MCSQTFDELIYPFEVLSCANLLMFYQITYICALIKQKWSSHVLFWMSFRYSLVLTAMYNLLNLISRYTPLIKCLRITSRSGLMIAILARFLFIPAFYFTAKYGDQGWMIMLTSLLGLTNGHLTVCVFAAAPKGYKVSWSLIHIVNAMVIKTV